MSSSLRPLSLLLPFLLALGCQRAENVAAKERLSSPPKPDPIVEQAQQRLDARALSDAATRKRIMRMPFQELASRLRSFQLDTEGSLSFVRDDVKVRSAETVSIEQAERGDFSVHVVTGDESEQRLAYVNEILFLKNNNGRWRTSRDPTGERNELLDDSAGIWRSFYDLFDHALVIESKGGTTYQGRAAQRYALSVTDQSAEARALAASEPSQPATTLSDGGVVEEDPAQVRTRTRDRLSQWRRKARPAGGAGEVVVDDETGALLSVAFEGRLLVGDAKTPGELRVRLKHRVSGIGKPHDIEPPQDAIDEIVRKKWPTDPRADLEKRGLVPPAPKAEGEPAAEGEGKGP